MSQVVETEHRPFITVIITAHDIRRKLLLKDAVISCIEQSIARPFYEIIVVKNYKDAELDNFIEGLNIRQLFKENASIGESLNAGIEAASGKIISFLDDDDIFLPNKLQTVYNNFKANDKLVFFHNFRSIFGGNDGFESSLDCSEESSILHCLLAPSDFEKISFHKLMEQHGIMSCISIRKDSIESYLQYLKHLTTEQDTFFFFLSLLSGGRLMFSREKLTKYRTGESVTRLVSDFESYWKRLNYIHSGDEYILSLWQDLFAHHALKSKIDNYISAKRLHISLMNPRRNKNVFHIAKSAALLRAVPESERTYLMFALALHTISPQLFRKITYMAHIRDMKKLGLIGD